MKSDENFNWPLYFQIPAPFYVFFFVPRKKAFLPFCSETVGGNREKSQSKFMIDMDIK